MSEYSINLPNTDGSLGFRVDNSNGNAEIGGTLATTGAQTVASLVCTAGATFGGGAGATGVTIGTDGTVTIDGITQINDNVALQFEGVAADVDGLKVSCDNAGDATIEVTAGKLTLNTSDNSIVATGEAISAASLALTSTLTVAGIVQINDNVALNFEGIAADVDGLQVTCDNAGDSLINSTAGNLTLTTSDNSIVTTSVLSLTSTTAGIVISAAEAIGISILTSTPTDGINIAAACANAIAIGGANIGHAIDIGSTWGVGITGGAIVVGDYSNAIAFGTISEHLIGQVINISAAVDDDSNIIPLHVAYANTADCGASSVAQVVYARASVAYEITDCYALRARLDITDATTPTVNQLYGVFSTMTTVACNMDATGMIALYGGTITGTADITNTSGYASVCGMYLSWEEQHAMTVNTNGILLNVAASCQIDYGMVVHLDGSGTSVGSSFRSIRSGGTITTALSIEGAHTNALALPAAGTAPVVASATAANDSAEGSIAITIGGVTKYLQYFAASA